MGWDRAIYLRENYCYGQDDHLCWPQPYSPLRPHLGCIRLTCTETRFQPLYEVPRLSDFEPWDDSSAIQGPRTWQRLQFTLFCEACTPIIRVAEDGTWEEPHKSLILTNTHYLRMFLEHVEALPLVFKQLRLCVAETQQLALELQAIMDYLTVYRPRMVGHTQRPSEEGSSGYDHLVGVFTMNPTVALEFCRAGVPVWYIHPLTMAGKLRIDTVEPVQEPLHLHIPTSPCCLKTRPIHVGVATDEAKYKAIERFTCSHLDAPNPFNTVQPPNLVHPEPAPSSVDLARYHPCMSRLIT